MNVTLQIVDLFHRKPDVYIWLLQLQVSPVTTRRLGSTNLIRDIRGTRTNEFRKKKSKKKKKFFFFFFFINFFLNFGSQGRN